MPKGKFKIGQSVLLRSGGPEMTIISFEEDHAYCSWFSGTAVKAHKFPTAGLKDAETPTKITVKLVGVNPKVERSDPDA